MGSLPDGTRSRTKIHPERITEIEAPYLAIVTEDARRRGMTLVEYAGWVGRMPKSELHVYRDQLRSGGGDQRLADTYDAWLQVRQAVTEMQFLMKSWNSGEPDHWTE